MGSRRSLRRPQRSAQCSALPTPPHRCRWRETTYLQCFHIATVAKASRTDAGMRPLIAHFPDMDTACIACANGRIVQVDIPSVERWHQGGYHSENELEETSYLKQIQSYVNTPMKMLFGSSNPPATPGRRDISYRTTRILSMDSIITNAVAVFLFALCDDDKIRVFNCDTRQHLKTIDLSVAVADPAASFTSMRGISSVVSGIGGLAVSHRRMSSLPNPENLRFEQNRVKIFGRAQTGFHGEMTSFYSSVYRPPSSDDVDAGEFLIYKGVVDASGRLSKQEFVFKKIGPAPSLIRTPGGRTVDELNLVDYCIMRKPSPESTPGTVSDSTLDAFQIWTLWSDGNGRGFVLHSGFSIKGESSGANGSPPPTPVFERWEDVAPRDPPAPFPPRVDVDFEDLDGPLNQLLQHLFESDRLSLSAIYQGLDSYAAAAGCSIAFNDAKSRLQVPANPLPTHYNALFDLARFTLKSQIETTIATSDTSSTNTILPPDAATIRQLRETVTKVEWMAFFSLCEQLDAAEHVPTGLCVNPHNRMLLVVQREAVAVVAASTISEVLFGTWTGTFSAAPMLLMSTAQMREAGANARLSDQAFRASLRGFFAVLDSLLGPAGRKGAADADGQIGNQSTEVSAGDAVAGVLGGGMWRAIMEDVIRKRIVDGEETAMDGLDLVRSVKEAADAVVKMQERGGLAPVKDSIASVGGVQFFLEALTRMLQDSLTESTVPLFERDSSAEDDAATDGSVSPFLDAVLLSGVAKAGEALSGLAAAALLLAGLAMLVDIEQPEPQGVELALAPVVVTLVNVLRAALIVSWTVRRHVTLSVSYTRPKDSTTADARPPGLSSATVNNAEAAGDLDPMEDLRWLDAGTAVVTVERSLTVAQLLVEDAVKDEALSLCRAALAGVSTGGMRPLNTSPFGESIRGGVALILARQLLGVRENDDDDDAEDYLTEPEVRRRDRLWGRGALWDGVVRVAATLAEREDGALAAAVKELLTLLPVSAASLYLRGKVLLRLGEVEKSKACFERAATGVLSRETSNLHYVVPAEILGASLVGYYQHVLTLFEEQRQYAVAAAFARLAHSCLAVEGNADEELKRRLQKTIFSNSLEALLFDEAFTALMALPDIEIQRLCLRRFITVACEYGKLEDLCVRYAFGHIQPDVEQILLFKVRNRQLLPIAPPKPAGERDPNVNFHHVLYSYYVQRGSYKNASTVMFDYARRLGAIDSSDVGGGSLSPVIAEQTRAYLAAINALHLVAPKSRWIIWRSTGRGITNPLKKKRKLSSMRTEESYGQDDGSGQNLPPPSTTSEVVELSDIQKEYALALSKLRLAEKYREYEVSGGLPEPSDAVALHIHDGDFDTALSLGLAFKTDLTVVFGLLAQRSVDLVVAESAEGATPLGTVIIEDMAGVRGPASVKAWRLVQMCLKMHDSGATGYAYRKAVVEKALERNRFLALPVWLTEFYKVKGVAPLHQPLACDINPNRTLCRQKILRT
ncbi:hypothetical protein DFJ73DRAFT_524332 [Zopfochytrium polystomum]|nr:hypothetical protein DFJ73DRAFT_524332 [Zopfochytrium polystomum]